MRITLVISTFAAGGAERVMSVMANYWAERGEDITLITLSSQSDDWYKLDPRVKRVGLGVVSTSTHIGQAIRHNIRRVICLRQALRRANPDMVISFLDTTNVLTLMASRGLGIPVIVSERNDPHQRSIGMAWNGLRSVLYRHADAVVVQSCAARDWALRLQGIKTIHVIPNPVNPMLNESEQASSRHGSSHTIVAMGRLVRQKGFDILIEAFGRCVVKHTGWSLIILGEGEERLNLERLAAEQGITDIVRLAGLVPDPALILRQAGLFVLSSRYEGFPNALLEAMACGLPVIATDCPSGPQEIIRDGIDGVLVRPGDVEALVEAMDRLMADSDERRRLGTGAREVIERFSMKRIMTIWDEAVTHACQAANQ